MSKGTPKIAVISPVLPPLSSGQAVMLYRVLEHIPADHYCLVSCFRPEIIGSAKHATAELPAQTHKLKSFSHPERMLTSPFAKLTEPFRYAADILYRAAQLRRLVHQQHITALVTCTGDFADMAASYLVSRTGTVKLVPYMFDYFSQQQTGLFRGLAERLEKRVMAIAHTTIVPNEFMQNELKKRYNAESVIIRNPCQIPPLPKLHAPRKEFKILYTGAVYNAHYDAMSRLVRALETLGNPNVQLHIYTAQEPASLAEFGIAGDHVVFHSHIQQEEIPKIQADADLLFLPLSFESTYDILIKTSAPGKMGEYMAIGRPILAHVPPDSFVEWYVTSRNCGRVVTSTNPQDLTKVLTEFLTNPTLSAELGKNGRVAAENDYALPIVQKHFRSLTDSLRS